MVVYPSPIRFVSFNKTESSVTADFSCLTGISVPAFENPYTGEMQEITDLTEYGLGRGYDEASVQYMASKAVKRVVEDYLCTNDADAKWMLDRINPKLDAIVKRVTALKIDSNHTAIDAVNYIYFLNYAGLDDGNYPDWIKTGIRNLSNGKLIAQIMGIIRQEAFSDWKSKCRFNLHRSHITDVLVGNAAVVIIDALGNDSNYREDNDTSITFSIYPRTSVFSKIIK